MAAHNGRPREQLNVYRGREVKTTGDGLLATFDSPARAVRCAVEMTRSVRAIGLEGSGIELEDAGAHELTGLPGLRQVFRLVVPPTQ